MKRIDFKRYLERLPPDDRFCTTSKCPLVTFAGRQEPYRQDGGYFWRDQFMDSVDSCGSLWHEITPRKCLAILAEVA